VTPDPKRNNAIMLLWTQGGYSYGEIARRLGITRNAVAGVVGRSGVRLPIKERLARREEGILQSANNRRKP
jgi:hypothetical protein